jgi:hypothetical protein
MTSSGTPSADVSATNAAMCSAAIRRASPSGSVTVRSGPFSCTERYEVGRLSVTATGLPAARFVRVSEPVGASMHSVSRAPSALSTGPHPFVTAGRCVASQVATITATP